MSEAELLPPELLDEIGDLEWIAGRAARLLAAGVHVTRAAGRGEEFERHRPYQQGDDLRHLDWKLLARTDRLYLRGYRERSHMRTVFVVDRTASMGFVGGGRVTKLRYAAMVVAILGHLARGAGDAVGLVWGGAGGALDREGTVGRDGLWAGRSRARWRALLAALERAQVDGIGHLAPALEEAVGRSGGASRIVVLSDFLEDDGGDALIRAVGHLRARGDEVGAIRILSPEELGARGGDEALYLDPERPERLLPAAPGRDPGYRARLDTYYERLREEFGARGAQWAGVSTTDPLVPVLRAWLRGGEVG